MNPRFLGFLAGLICIGAGIYLFTLRAKASDSLVQAFANGVDLYCVGRGVGIIASTNLQFQLLPKPPEQPAVEPGSPRFKTKAEYDAWKEQGGV